MLISLSTWQKRTKFVEVASHMFLFIHCCSPPSPSLHPLISPPPSISLPSSPPPSSSPHSAIRQQSSSGSELEQKLRKVFAFITTCEDGSSGRKTGSSTPVSPLAVEARPALLLELASVCVEHHFTQLALQCMDLSLKNSWRRDPS